jgi:hypothetical protein
MVESVQEFIVFSEKMRACMANLFLLHCESLLNFDLNFSVFWDFASFRRGFLSLICSGLGGNC